MGSRLRILALGLVIGLGALALPSLAWAGGTWMYASSDHTQLQISFQTDNGQTADFEVFTLSVPVMSATCPGGGAGSVGQPDNNPDQFECQISPAASSGTVSVTTDPESCGAQIANEASFDGFTYTPQNSVTPVSGNCPPPVASFTASSNPKPGTPVSFNGSGSMDPNAGGSITAYSWNFGDGSPSATGAMVTHTYPESGQYTVMLTVTDTEGGTNSVTHTVTVAAGSTGHPPVNTGLPQISGDAVTGDTLTASTGTWTNDPTSFGYLWLSCDPQGNQCGSVGADGSSYKPTADDIGATLRVVVTATNANGSTSATSDPTAGVEPLPLTVGPTSTNGPTVTLPVDCSKSDAEINGNCLLLFLLAALGGGQPTTGPAPDLAIAASCHRTSHHHCPKLLVVGRTKLKIPAGHTKHVRITLNRAGRRLLAKNHKLRVRLTITEDGHTVSTRTIVFKARPPTK